MSLILDAALEMYVKDRIKNSSTRDFESACNSHLHTFTELCQKENLSQESEIRIINKILLPYIDAVKKTLKEQELSRETN